MSDPAHSLAAAPVSLEVHAEIAGETVLVATVRFRHRGATTTSDFTYAPTYLADPRCYPVDPALPLTATTHVIAGLPGCLSDTTPDWWGRQLITRQRRLDASRSRAPMSLITEVDHLVGVSDLTRQGNLRVALPGGTDFLAPDLTVPPLVRLPDLLAASARLTSEHATDEAVSDALQTLLAAGSATLGGARPKASVMGGIDEGEARLLIAKFPWREDEWDVMAWEKTALDLAERCGIPVPARRLVDVGDQHVLLVERFDRRPDGGRVGYLSARTLAERSSSAGNDYLDLVAAVEDHSSAAAADLRDLWRRIAVTVALHNSDDHFHNHGFLRTGSGWRLAPAFDINIDPRPAQPRATSLVGAADRDGTLRALVREATYFGLEPDRARTGLLEIRDVLEGWRDVAAANRVPGPELDSVGWVIDDYCRTVRSAST